jgi:hypothetical protein
MQSRCSAIITFVCLCLTLLTPGSLAFHPSTPLSSSSTTRQVSQLRATTTVEAPTREKTDKSTRTGQNDNADEIDYPDLEYLQDPSASREIDDPFHILLMGSTFEKPKVTVPYVAQSLEYVLNMPGLEAKELSKFAKEEGMACLGTWPREECLSLGRQLQVRDLDCRVVPYCEGGQRGWQAKNAGDASSARSGGSYPW